jgi:hypothetical protein
MKVSDGMTMTLTLNEWFAIVSALKHTHATYSEETHGVELNELSEVIRTKYMGVVK